MGKIYLWTDGGCSPNPGRGGWAYLIESAKSGKTTQASGHLPSSTNNRAELTAVIRGLQRLRHGPHDVTLYTDSEYVRLAVEGMRKPKTNYDLLQRVQELCGLHHVRVLHISAHTGVSKNELCDQLASAAVYKNR